MNPEGQGMVIGRPTRTESVRATVEDGGYYPPSVEIEIPIPVPTLQVKIASGGPPRKYHTNKHKRCGISICTIQILLDENMVIWESPPFESHDQPDCKKQGMSQEAARQLGLEIVSTSLRRVFDDVGYKLTHMAPFLRYPSG